MKKLLLPLVLALAATLAVAADRPYDEAADAKAQIAAALHDAAAAKEPVLLIFGETGARTVARWITRSRPAATRS